MSHEPQGLDSRRLAIAGGILAASTAVVLVICYFLWQSWAASEPQPVRGPGQPSLQAHPAGDLAAFSHEQTRDDRWEWVDRNGRVARIPVRRAMELMAKEPSR